MAEAALDITLQVSRQEKEIEISVERRRKRMAMAVEKSTSPVEEYEGPYTTVSQLYYGRVLETEGKRMAANLVVDPIPIHEVSNPVGGITVTIGS